MSDFSPQYRASAWKPADFGSAEAYTVRLDDADRRELLAAARAAMQDEATLDTATVLDHPLPGLADRLRAAAGEVRGGRGFVVLGGLPVDGGVSLTEFTAACRLLGMHFGHSLSQNPAGDLVGHVIDASAEDATPRMYRSNLELRPHTDMTSMISLATWHPAERGGASIVVSAATVHDAVRRSRPDLLECLYRGFHYHRMGEELEGAEPVTPWRVPVFARHDGLLSVRYLRSNIAAGHKVLGVPLTGQEIEALNVFDATAAAPEHRLAFHLQRGDMIVMNNYTVLHARTSFKNFDDPARRRHLVRLWLDAPDFRDVPPELHMHGINGVPRQPGRRNTLDFRKLYADDPVATGGVADLGLRHL